MSFASMFYRAGQVMTDSRWWSFYLQRQFLSRVLRDHLSVWIATKIRPQNIHTPNLEPVLKQRVADLKDSGISHLGQLLSPEKATELRDYFSQKLVKDPYRPTSSPFLPESSERHPDIHIAHHTAQDILKAPYLLSIINRSDILSIVEKVLGCKPTLGYLAAWWSYNTDKGAQQAEHFHRDVDDWRFLKLFIYLSDVGTKNGPHIYVKYSSTSTELRELRRFTDDEIISTFGANNIVKLTGRAGEAFLEDTFGIHKGQPVEENTRLIFQAVYSIYPLPYGPKRPIMALKDLMLEDGSYPDPWINRLYLRDE